ncbi:MAG: recombination protein RecR [Verrucomicrobia bacterium TMED44]|nr:MAG: recombination protein RecR [Verrucomicrobia bacterium TMED44]
MNEPYERLVQSLKALPGLGYRSAEKIALHLLVEKPAKSEELTDRISVARQQLGPCLICGNLTDEDECNICSSEVREVERLCIVENVTDLFAMEKAGVFRGKYHILMGKLSPVRGVGPEQLNINSLQQRLENSDVEEVILALSNDMEGEATCHFIKNEVLKDSNLEVTRIGFGLPSGGGITYADENTLLNALQSRKTLDS